MCYYITSAACTTIIHIFHSTINGNKKEFNATTTPSILQTKTTINKHITIIRPAPQVSTRKGHQHPEIGMPTLRKNCSHARDSPPIRHPCNHLKSSRPVHLLRANWDTVEPSLTPSERIAAVFFRKSQQPVGASSG